MDNRYNFAVVLPGKDRDTTGFYKQGLINKITTKYPWLSVAGLDSPHYTNNGRYIRGVEYAKPGSLLTFGTAKSHDVNWVERPDYAREKSYAPVYDAVKDWNTIVGRLDAFANARKPITRSTYCGCPIQYCGLNSLLIDGTTVRIFDNFIQIGYTIIPRFPKVQEYYVFEKPEVTRVIITIKNMF